MSSMERMVARISQQHRVDNVQWIVLEKDSDTSGYALFGHISLDEPCEYDYWYPTKGEALDFAESEWGIKADSWDKIPNDSNSQSNSNRKKSD